MQRRLVRCSMGLAVLVAALALPAAAAAQGLCLPNETAGDKQLILDANTGGVLSGETWYRRNSQVEVIVARKNPYKYTYTYSVENRVIDSSGTISAFLGLIAPLGAVSELFTPAEEASARAAMNAMQANLPMAARTAVGAAGCSGVDAEILDRLRADLQPRIAESSALTARVRALQTNHDLVQAARAAFLTATEPDVLVCAMIDPMAQNTQAMLAGFTLGTSPADVSAHTEAIKGTKALLEFLIPTDPECRKERTELLLIAQGLQLQATNLADAVRVMSENKKNFDQLAALISSVRASNPYFERHSISGGRRPSVATITTTRTPRRPADAKAETLKKVEVEFGQAFFTLSIGGGASFIEEESITKEASLIPDGSGGEVLGERFAVETSAKAQPLGIVALNANIWHPWDDVTVALSAGVSIADGDQESDFGYFFGPSFSFLDNSLYLSIGAHFRETGTLGGGFEDSDPIPEGLEGIPIREDGHIGVILAVSYRVQ